MIRDLAVNMNKPVPHHSDYHHAEGNSDAHIKSSLFGCDQIIIAKGDNIQLGTWQKIFLCEFYEPKIHPFWRKLLPNAYVLHEV